MPPSHLLSLHRSLEASFPLSVLAGVDRRLVIAMLRPRDDPIPIPIRRHKSFSGVCLAAIIHSIINKTRRTRMRKQGTEDKVKQREEESTTERRAHSMHGRTVTATRSGRRRRSRSRSAQSAISREPVDSGCRLLDHQSLDAVWRAMTSGWGDDNATPMGWIGTVTVTVLLTSQRAGTQRRTAQSDRCSLVE